MGILKELIQTTKFGRVLTGSCEAAEARSGYASNNHQK